MSISTIDKETSTSGIDEDLDPNSSHEVYKQYYLDKYPIKYLLLYPDFMAKKLKRDDLKTWIASELNPDSTKRTKDDIKRFFSLKFKMDLESGQQILTEEENENLLPAITRSDIAYTGW